MVNHNHAISTRLKIARIASGYHTSKEFAELNGIPLTTYCQLETGKRAMTIESLFNYSTWLNIEPSWLLTGQGNPCGEFGDKDLEQKILARQETLGRSGHLETSAIPTISLHNKYSNINIEIFKKVLHDLLPLLKDLPNSNTDDVIDFCFELYNRIVTTDVEDDERGKLIKICLESFFSGLGIRVADDTIKNLAMIG